jgi:hypothetical protein
MMSHLFKFILFAILIILGYNSELQACDLCGCTSGADMGGVLPQFQKNITGIRYREAHFRHTGSVLSQSGNDKVEEDVFRATELWLRYFPSKRVQLIFNLPYQSHQRLTTGASQTISGVGDIQLQSLYTIVNTAPSPENLWRHLWMVGAGVKLPNAPYQQRNADQLLFPAAFQLGTGAYAASIHMVYSLRFKRLGVQGDMNFRYHGENELSYQFGRQLFGGAQLFYWLDYKNWMFLPQLGWTAENMASDQEYSLNVPHTGAQNQLLGLGLDVYYKRLLFGIQWRKPMIINQPQAMPEPAARLQFTLGWFFQGVDGERKPVN